MAFDYINEAFKKLDLLEEKMFDTSLNGINELSDFLDNDDTDEIIRVIDPEANTVEEVQDSYVGKVIINCNICHSHIFEEKDNIKIEDDGAVNIEEQCPYCGETEGFTIVGEIAPFAETKVEVDGEEVEVEEKPEDEEESEEPVFEESYSRATLRAQSALAEDFKEVSVTTGDQHMEMSSDENGRISITSEPITESSDIPTEDVIAPISDETQQEILDNNNVVEEPADDLSLDLEAEEPSDEEPVEGEETQETEETADEGEEVVEESLNESVDVDFDEVDEECVDAVCEKYLKKVYENVDSFNTTSVSTNDTQMIVEGTITFSSGAKKNTGFIFEACDIKENDRIRFRGYNKHLTESTNAFTLVGVVDNKKLFVESLKYNYTVNNNTVRGVARSRK